MAKAKAKTTKSKTPPKPARAKTAPVKAVAKPKAARSKTATKAKTTQSAKPAKKTKGSQPRRLKDRLNRPLLIAAGILIIGAGVIAANYDNASEPAPVNQASYSQEAKAFADEIITHIKDGECEEIFAKTSDGFRAVISEDNWLEQCDIATSVLTGSTASVELADSNSSDDVTEYSYSIAATDGQTYVVTVQLVSRDGQWQLQGINSQVEGDV